MRKLTKEREIQIQKENKVKENYEIELEELIDRVWASAAHNAINGVIVWLIEKAKNEPDKKRAKVIDELARMLDVNGDFS